MTETYRRIGSVDEEEFEDDLVVMNTRTEAVVTLNGAARLVWDALAEDVTLDQLTTLFAEVSPDTEPAAVRRDLAATLESLLAAELVMATQAGE